MNLPALQNYYYQNSRSYQQFCPTTDICIQQGVALLEQIVQDNRQHSSYYSLISIVLICIAVVLSLLCAAAIGAGLTYLAVRRDARRGAEIVPLSERSLENQ